jgi:hypothetical protein
MSFFLKILNKIWAETSYRGRHLRTRRLSFDENNTKLLSFYLEVENLFRIRVALYCLQEEFTNDDYGLRQERSCNAENKLSISTQRIDHLWPLILTSTELCLE